MISYSPPTLCSNPFFISPFCIFYPLLKLLHHSFSHLYSRHLLSYLATLYHTCNLNCCLRILVFISSFYLFYSVFQSSIHSSSITVLLPIFPIWLLYATPAMWNVVQNKFGVPFEDTSGNTNLHLTSRVQFVQRLFSSRMVLLCFLSHDS